MTSSAAVVGRASGADIIACIFGRLAAAEILPRCGAQRAVKHGGEGAGAAVSETVRDARHGVSLSKPADRLGQTYLLTPLREAHARFALEEPRQRAGTGANALSPGIERAGRSWIVEKRAAERGKPSIRWQRNSKRYRGRARKLRQDECHHQAGGAGFV